MVIGVCFFTKQGENIATRLFGGWSEMHVRYRTSQESLEVWAGECFRKHLPILFIGACGIAVRTIAPFVKDKLSDSAVLVMDEKGKYVIPILSGHMGGANEMAAMLAKRIDAQQVITTATDVEDIFSVDVFAKRNGFRIHDRVGIRMISSKLLAGENVTVAVSQEFLAKGLSMPPEQLRFVASECEDADIRIAKKINDVTGTQRLLLTPKRMVLGMGCRKGKSYDELLAFLEENLPAGWKEELFALASVDLKREEEGLQELAQFLQVPFLTYPAEILAKVAGEFHDSQFVEKVTGVSNVCERAAIYCAGEGAMLEMEKTAGGGITAALASRNAQIRTWNTSLKDEIQDEVDAWKR